jgi:isoamylase
MALIRFETTPGRPLPLGATATADGVQFAVFSRNAAAVTLDIFATPEDGEPVFEYRLDPDRDRTGDIWHVFITGLKPGTFYLYRVDGPYKPEKGLRFNAHKFLLDPYAKALTGNFVWNLNDARGYNPASPEGDLSFSTIDDAAVMPKGIVVSDDFDWQGDRPLNYPLRFSILYETHVRGLSMKNADVGHPGTYKGVVESIPYFKELGITSLELMPVMEFDEFENPRKNPRTGERLQNYWGYSTISFFAPKGMFSSSGSLGQQVTEFKEMVRDLHRAGIEVILDIVFNHTAEGNEAGPTISFRGFDNSIYYILDDNKRFYKNYSGCGNTLNCNNPVVRGLIIDCLRYWVIEMHVDGFRFDLGSILGRDQNGKLMENPPVIERIAEDPVLRNTKIIAEAWDAAGAYQVGWFPGGRWAEWNDRFRDDVRRFWRGDEHSIQAFATRLTGSSDLYLRDGRKPFHSINFVTSHDGFTLNDLVCYNGKHNEENGESGNDGNNSNFSYNYGFEGPGTNPTLERLRNRQTKNFLATIFLSLGTHMILGGDEFRRTQRGNNNAYCQNNDISWYDWGSLEKHADVYRFAKEIIAFRKRHPAFLRPEFYTGKDASFNAIPDITWFDARGQTPDWAKIDKVFALRIDGSKADVLSDRDDNDCFMLFNASSDNAIIAVCDAPVGKKWYRVVDTAAEPPEDIFSPGTEVLLSPQKEFLARPRSMAVFISKYVY